MERRISTLNFNLSQYITRLKRKEEKLDVKSGSETSSNVLFDAQRRTFVHSEIYSVYFASSCSFYPCKSLPNWTWKRCGIFWSRILSRAEHTLNWRVIKRTPGLWTVPISCGWRHRRFHCILSTSLPARREECLKICAGNEIWESTASSESMAVAASLRLSRE